MINYCPIDFDEPVHKPEKKEPEKPKEEPSLFKNEDTECNYLVMFFIVGVLLLAVSDQVRK